MRRSIKRLKGIATQTLLALSVLTAAKGVNYFMDHEERFYNLNMSKVVITAHKKGIDGEYWIDDKGLKRLGDYVMCAGHPSRYGEIIDTSLGVKGIIVDTGDFAKKNPTMIDIATNW